jgi:hypothetical protein
MTPHGESPIARPELLATVRGAKLYHASWRELAGVVERVDLTCVDSPYSERTHRGHNDGTATINRATDHARRQIARGGGRAQGGVTYEGRIRAAERDGGDRRPITYAPWTPRDVDAFVDCWAPKTRGWFLAFSDHVLAPAWEAALERHDRYVFAPLACVEPGSRIRTAGDGPANWATWLIVSRPQERFYARWGSLPGAYVVPPGEGDTRSGRRQETRRIVGAKPLWMMERIVEHYSRPGMLVCDPCMGGATTLRAASKLGRPSIGGDIDRDTALLAVERLRGEGRAR